MRRVCPVTLGVGIRSPAPSRIVRLIATVVLVVMGSRAPGAYGLALVLPPAAAMAIGLRGQKGLMQPGPTAPYSELSSAIGYLLLGSVLVGGA